MKKEFKVGQEVVIRRDLVEGQMYGADDVVSEMLECCGKTATITSVLWGGKKCRLDVDESQWCWTPEMFEEEVVEIKEEDMVKVVAVEGSKRKEKYIGKMARVRCVYTIGKFKYSIRFLDEELQKDNEWCFSDGELELVPTAKPCPKKEEIKVGDIAKVVDIVANHSAQTEKYIGEFAKVIEVDRDCRFPYTLEFLNKDVQERNKIEGTWVWLDEELELVENPTSLLNRKIIGADKVTVINYPAIIHIIERDGKKYKGVAKLMDGDEWDEAKGIEIAKTRAEMKYLEKKLKKLTK